MPPNFFETEQNHQNALNNKSNSNLFVFKNGWTSTNKESVVSGPVNFKQRPQSSNHYAKKRQANGSSGASSDKRVWKYNKSNNEIVPGVSSLNPNKT